LIVLSTNRIYGGTETERADNTGWINGDRFVVLATGVEYEYVLDAWERVSSDATSIQGYDVEAVVPGLNQILRFNTSGSTWEVVDQDITWAQLQGSNLTNEILNFPSAEGADDTLPLKWTESGGISLTEVDVAGEGITETYGRALKVDGSSTHAYQRFTYADHPRLKAGLTVSAIMAAWAVGGVGAEVWFEIVTSTGTTLASSTADTEAWTVLTAEGLVLDGTWVQIELWTTGVGYLVPLSFHIGDRALPLMLTGQFLTTTTGQHYPVAAKGSTYTTDEDDHILLCDGTFTVNLIAAANFAGGVYHIKNVGTGTITIDPAASETIDGETTQELSANDSMMIVSDGTEWWVI